MELERIFKESIGNPNTKHVVADILEVGLDKTLDPSLLKDVPLLGALAKVYDLTTTIKNRLFLLKLASFLNNVERLSPEQKFQFFERLGNKNSNHIGTEILFVIDKLESTEKSDIIGKLFNSLMFGDLNKEEFDDLVFGVSSLQLRDLDILLIDPKELQYIEPQKTGRLYNYGLFDMPLEIMDAMGDDKNGKKYVLSKIGVKFVNIVYQANCEYKEYEERELNRILGLD